MKKIVLSLIGISTLTYAAESEKTALLQAPPPPAYDESQGSSAAPRPSLAEQVAKVENDYFLEPFMEGNAQEMIRRASIYRTGDANDTIPKSNYDCLALLSLASAFDTTGQAACLISDLISDLNGSLKNQAIRKSYMAHAAALKNSKALGCVESGWVTASYDTQANLFAQVVTKEADYSVKEKYDYAITLLGGTSSINAQPVRALAIAALLARKYPKNAEGHKLLMYFANGYLSISDQVVPSQEVLKPDYVFVKRYAEKFNALENNASSLTWLASLEATLGNLDEAEELCKQALALKPNYKKAEQKLKDIRTKKMPACCTIL